jgi:restriction system protein
MTKRQKFINARELSLDAWLTMLFNPPSGGTFVDWAFPSRKHREEYIASINKRSEEEVYHLLRIFLIPSGTLGIDDSRFEWLVTAKRNDPQLYTSLMEKEYYRRLALFFTGQSEIPPWEGITWVLDLLPHFPKEALEGLNAYFLAHAQSLPDGRLSSLADAAALMVCPERRLKLFNCLLVWTPEILSA